MLCLFGLREEPAPLDILAEKGGCCKPGFNRKEGEQWSVVPCGVGLTLVLLLSLMQQVITSPIASLAKTARAPVISRPRAVGILLTVEFALLNSFCRTATRPSLCD